MSVPVPAPTAMAKSGTLQGESEESLSADEDAEIDSHAQPQCWKKKPSRPPELPVFLTRLWQSVPTMKLP